MALQKVNYTNNQTVITAENMNDIQDAIIEADKKAEEAKEAAKNATVTTDATLTIEGAAADAKATGDAVAAVQNNLSTHNTNTGAHADLRLELQKLSNRINAALDSDDETLDELSEIVEYIKSNKSLIDAITTSKVSVSDIVDNLVTNVANKPLSAAQGVVLKALIDAVTTTASEAKTAIEDLDINKIEQSDLEAEVESQLDASKADIVAEIISQLGGLPVFGTVADDKTITVTSELADGKYTLMYENEDGTLSEIGKITVGALYTNLADPTSEDFLENYRINSSGSVVAATNGWVTNWIPATRGDVIRLKGFDITFLDQGSGSAGKALGADSNKANGVQVWTYQIYDGSNTQNAINQVVKENGIQTYTVLLGGDGEQYGATDVQYVRFAGNVTGNVEDVVITVNEEIL